MYDLTVEGYPVIQVVRGPDGWTARIIRTEGGFWRYVLFSPSGEQLGGGAGIHTLAEAVAMARSSVWAD